MQPGNFGDVKKYQEFEETKLIDYPFAKLKQSKSQLYWAFVGFNDFYKKIRTPHIELSQNIFKEYPQRQISYFRLKGIEFGNWTNQEDRFNYFVSVLLSFMDLNLILNFNNNLGLFETLTIAIGSRGSGKAKAHFDRTNWIINLTRYKRADKLIKEFKDSGIKIPTDLTKEKLFLCTGGITALAHEYGHFIDYWAGSYLENKPLLTQRKKSIDIAFIQHPKNLAELANNIIHKIIFDKSGNLSNYYFKLKKAQLSNYWYRHNELFARAFEVYINLKLQQKNISNIFLTKPKYEDYVYLTEKEFKEKGLLKLFDELIENIGIIARKKEFKK